MNHFTHDTDDVAPRRGFFARAAGAIALGLAGFAPSPLRLHQARKSRSQRIPRGISARLQSGMAASN
jgi:hypothetical protein